MEGQYTAATDGAEQNRPRDVADGDTPAKADRHEDGGPTDADVLAMARDLYPKAVTYWKDNYDQGRIDVKVARLNDQWPENIKKFRTDNRLPMVTVNLLEKDVMEVVNEGRQNRASIKVGPGEGGNKDVADAQQGMVRAIEQDSRAYIAYDLALEHAADRSVGFCWVAPRYVDDESFDQVLEILLEDEPFSVFMDPEAGQPDGSDAEYCFRARGVELERFKRKYPNAKTDGFDASGAASEALALWVQDAGKTVTVCDFLWADCTYVTKTVAGRSRQVEKRSVWWFKVTANDVLLRQKIAGPYLPIARCMGRAIKLDRKLHTKSVVRNGIDPQRQYNYDRTLYQQSMGMSSKAHAMGTEAMFKGYEDQWDNAHMLPQGRLLYNVDPKAPGLKPELLQPKGPDAAAMAGAQQAKQDIYDTTGIYPSAFGNDAKPEASGKAIRQRKLQGQEQTFDFHDNQATMIAHVGRILLAMIPEVYDTDRMVRVLQEDGTPGEVRLDPSLPPDKPVEMRKSTVDDRRVKHVNVKAGRYSVTVSTGPSYATRRQEGAEAMVELYSGFNDLQKAAVAPDILRGMDFPGSDKMAEKLDLLVPPQVRSAQDMEGDDPKRVNAVLMGQVNQLSQMNQQLQQAVQQMGAALEDKQTEHALEAAKIEAGRMKELLEAQSTVQAAVINALGNQGTEAIRARAGKLAPALGGMAGALGEEVGEPAGDAAGEPMEG